MKGMRVLYYTFPHLLDPALEFVRELSWRVELFVLLEMTPQPWSALFSTPPVPRQTGIVPAAPILADYLPRALARYWADVAGFHLVAYQSRRSIHPASLLVNRKAAQYIKRLRPDIVHFDDVSLRLALSFRELPAIDILTVHDPKVHSGEEDWRRDLARWLMFRRVRHFVVHSEAMREPLARDYNISARRIHRTQLGIYNISREWMGPPLAQDERTILFFGRLSAYKGIETLFHAAPLVADRVPNVRFVVAGSPQFGYIPPVPPVMPCGGRIDLEYGHLGNERLAELLQRATVVVCPYNDATQSGVVLTAYAFERAIVATNVGGLPEYVRHQETGLIVPPRDPDALARALVAMLTDVPLRLRLGAESRSLGVSDLSWRRTVDRTLEIYRSVLIHKPTA